MLKARRSDRPPATKKRINKKSNTIKNSYNLKLGFIKKYIIYIFLSLIIFLLIIKMRKFLGVLNQ